jgi:hypothetical protein
MSLTNYGKPVRRPSSIVIANAFWEGDSQDLGLVVDVKDENGQTIRLTFPCTGEDGIGQICLPSRADINSVERQAIISSVRMAMFVGDYVPWSYEAIEAFVQQEGAALFQTAIGKAKISDTGLSEINDVDIWFDIKKYGTSNPVRRINTTFDELARYTLEPVSQMWIIPGSVKYKFSSFVHDPDDGKELNDSQKQDIIDYLMGGEFSPWI